MQCYATLFFVSFILCLIIILSSGYGFSRRGNIDQVAVQSAHTGFVPRVGGLAIYIAILVLIPLLSFGFIPLSIVFDLNAEQLTLLILSAAPVFVAGLAEDFGYSVSPKFRLIASAASSLIAILLFKVWLDSLGIPGVDTLLMFAPFGILFTIFAAVGVVNAFNLIDGLTGLSSYVTISVAFALSIIAFQTGNTQISIFLVLIVSSVLGFMALNFPIGKIFWVTAVPTFWVICLYGHQSYLTAMKVQLALSPYFSYFLASSRYRFGHMAPMEIRKPSRPS